MFVNVIKNVTSSRRSSTPRLMPKKWPSRQLGKRFLHLCFIRFHPTGSRAGPSAMADTCYIYSADGRRRAAAETGSVRQRARLGPGGGGAHLRYRATVAPGRQRRPSEGQGRETRDFRKVKDVLERPASRERRHSDDEDRENQVKSESNDATTSNSWLEHAQTSNDERDSKRQSLDLPWYERQLAQLCVRSIATTTTTTTTTTTKTWILVAFVGPLSKSIDPRVMSIGTVIETVHVLDLIHPGDIIPFPTPVHGYAKRKCGFFTQHHGHRVNCRCNHNFVCLA